MKKGFVFIETMIVLVVVVVSLLTVYKSYSTVTRNIKKKEYYDNVNDIYKVNTIRSIFKNYNVSGDYLYIDKDNCTDYMSSDCASLITNMNINYIVLTSTNIENILDNPRGLSNSLLQYLGVIEDGNKTMIISTQNYGEEYFASLKIGTMVINLINNSSFTSSPVTGWSTTPSSVTNTVSGTITPNGLFINDVSTSNEYFNYYNYNFIDTHKYYFSSEIKLQSQRDLDACQVMAVRNSSGILTNTLSPQESDDYKTYSMIFDASSHTHIQFGSCSSSYSIMYIKNVRLIDLTADFGAGNEPNTTTLLDKVPYFKKSKSVILE